MSKKDKPIETVKIREFNPIEDLPESATMIIVGPPATGKSTFIQNMAYYLRHRYPVARVFIKTPEDYKKHRAIFGPLFVSNYWSKEEEEKHVERQQTCELENGRGYRGNYAINIIDDASDDPSIYRTPLFTGLVKNGSQHYAQLLMIGMQYAIDMLPAIRSNLSFVALGREPNELNREKLWKNFGGIAGSKARFYDLLDQITGDHTFLIIKMRSDSNKLEDCIFWYKTRQIPPTWRFGSKEFREWNDQRYDQGYIEQIIV